MEIYDLLMIILQPKWPKTPCFEGLDDQYFTLPLQNERVGLRVRTGFEPLSKSFIVVNTYSLPFTHIIIAKFFFLLGEYYLFLYHNSGKCDIRG